MGMGLRTYLEKSVMDVDRLQELCASLTAQRQVAVNRAKAAIETCDAESRSSAVALLEEAMQPSRVVDFPLVTEISERLACRPIQAIPAAEFLVAVLKEEARDTSRQLKALTIAHELLYDASVKDAIADAQGIQAALQLLQIRVEHSSLQGPAAESIRMFAAEIERRCFHDDDAEESGRRPGCQAWLKKPWGRKSSAGSTEEPGIWEGRLSASTLFEDLQHKGSRQKWDGEEGAVMYNARGTPCAHH